MTILRTNNNSAFMATKGDARGLMEGLIPVDGDPIPGDGDHIPGEGGKNGGKGGCGDAEDGGGKGGKGMDSGGHRRNRCARKNRRFLSSGKRESDRGGATAAIEDGGDPDGLVVGVIGCAEAEFEEDGGFERGL